MRKNKRGVNVIALLIGTSGLVVTIILSFVLPDTLYEYLTTSAGVLLIVNWIIILASQIKNRKHILKVTLKERNLKCCLHPIVHI